MTVCKHKFNDAYAHMKKRGIPGNEWSMHMVMNTPLPYIFEKFVNGHGKYHELRYNRHGDLFYIKGVAEQVDDLLNGFIVEEYPKFTYNVIERPLGLEMDPECPECSYELKLLNGDIKEVTYENKAKKAMTGRAASIIKQAGHKNEGVAASRIKNAHVLPDDGRKPDISAGEGAVMLSCKKYGKRYQVFLHPISKFREHKTFAEYAYFLGECLEVFPKSREEYRAKEPVYKRKLASVMMELKGMISHPEDLRKFFDISFFDSYNGNKSMRANSIILGGEDNVHYVYEKKEMLDILANNVEVCNSTGDYGPQKVTFKARIGRNSALVIMGEVEVRKDRHNYRNLKCFMRGPEVSNSLLRLLRRKIIKEEIINDRIVLCGDASQFKEDLMLENSGEI